MYRIVGRLLLLVVLLSAVSPLTAQKERKLTLGGTQKKVALIVGNSTYTNTAPLVNPKNDAEDMAKTLKKLGFDVIAKQDLNRKEMYVAFGEFSKKLQDADVGLFYYSGHGVQSNGSNFLIPIAGSIKEEEHLESRAVQAQSVLDIMRKAKCPLNIVVLDACRDNPFVSAVRSNKRGLASVQAPAGTFIIYATDQGDTASDNPDGRNGLFTQELVAHIQTPGLKFEDVFKRTARTVQEKSVQAGKRQVPWISSSFVGDFYFVLPPPDTPKTYSTELSVNTNPEGATVIIDDKVFGKTPIKRQRLDLGTSEQKEFSIVLALPPDYASFESKFTAEAGRPLKIDTFTLDRLEVDIKVETQLNRKDEAEMVFVPAGEFEMGSTEGKNDEKPVHKVHTDGFWIYRTPVTVAMYQRYCRETGKKMPATPPKWGWRNDDPMVNITWEEARNYCSWAGGRLPTEAEWEKAARGTKKNLYPWGNVWDESLANSSLTSNTGPVRVGNYRRGASPYGVLDMAGNVWQWCHDWYEADYYTKSSNRNPQGPRGAEARVVRGGSFESDAASLRTTNRSKADPKQRLEYVGFRCVIHR
jgi:formylglycine-generating enzyme required for sulfatase activity